MTGVQTCALPICWNGGYTMSEKLIVSNVFGAITDYLVEGKKIFLIAGSNLSAFFEKILSGEFSRGSILYYYNLPR